LNGWENSSEYIQHWHEEKNIMNCKSSIYGVGSMDMLDGTIILGSDSERVKSIYLVKCWETSNMFSTSLILS
jgi:hypothetical protein